MLKIVLVLALSFGYLQLFCGGQPFHGYEMNESDRGGYNDKNLNEDGEYQDYLKEKHFGNRDMIDKELETRKDPQDNWGLSNGPYKDCSSFNTNCVGCRGYLKSCCYDKNCETTGPKGKKMICKEGTWLYTCYCEHGHWC